MTERYHPNGINNGLVALVHNAESNTVKETKSSPTTTSTQNAKLKSRRATRACLGCRSRKVRCDVILKWPCGNCTWRDETCTVRKRDFHKRWPESRSSALRDIVPSCAGSTMKTAAGPPEAGREHEMLEACIISETQTSALPVAMQHKRSKIDARPLLELSGQQTSLQATPLAEEASFIPMSEIRRKYSRDELTFLQTQNVFHIPSAGLRHALFRAFFNHVYPTMPIVDIEDFILAMTSSGKGSERTTSLLLLQAVLFSGAAHVDVQELEKAGFCSRFEAVSAYFRKAVLLYDTDYELNHTVLAQVSLLFSLRDSTPNEHRTPRYWTDVAVSHAVAAGLNHDSTSNKYLPKTKRIRCRIWWSCFIRDHVLSLDCGTALRTRGQDFDTKPPSYADFDSEGMAIRASEAWTQICSFAIDESFQQQIAVLFVSWAALCRSMSLISVVPGPVGCFPLGPKPVADQEAEDKLSLQFVSSLGSLSAWYDQVPLSLYEFGSCGPTLPDQLLGLNRSREHLFKTYHSAALQLYKSRLGIHGSATPISVVERQLLHVLVNWTTEKIADPGGHARAPPPGSPSHVSEYSAASPVKVGGMFDIPDLAHDPAPSPGLSLHLDESLDSFLEWD